MIVKYLTEVTDEYFILVVYIYLLLCYSVRIYILTCRHYLAASRQSLIRPSIWRSLGLSASQSSVSPTHRRPGNRACISCVRGLSSFCEEELRKVEKKVKALINKRWNQLLTCMRLPQIPLQGWRWGQTPGPRPGGEIGARRWQHCPGALRRQPKQGGRRVGAALCLDSKWSIAWAGICLFIHWTCRKDKISSCKNYSYFTTWATICTQSILRDIVLRLLWAVSTRWSTELERIFVPSPIALIEELNAKG